MALIIPSFNLFSFVFSSFTFVLALESRIPVTTSHDQITASDRKILAAAEINSSSASPAANDCAASSDNIMVFQGLESTNGIPRYNVMISNMCDSNCQIRNLHLHCGWFASARTVNPALFKRVANDDCLVNGGEVIPFGGVIRFRYENTYRYPLSVASYDCQ